MWSTKRWQRHCRTRRQHSSWKEWERLPKVLTDQLIFCQQNYRRVVSLNLKLDKTAYVEEEKKKKPHEGKMIETSNNCKMMCTRVTKDDWFNVANWIHIVHSCISFKNFKQKKKLRGEPRCKVKERLMLKGFRSCRRRTRTTTTTTMTMNHQEKKPDRWSILGQVLGYIPPKRVLRFKQNSRHQKRKFNKRPHPKSWEEQLLITSRVNLIRF